MQITPGLQLGNRPPNRGRAPSVVAVTMAGLEEGVAVPGRQDAVSVPTPAGVSWTSERWGTSYGDATYGNAANPADYTASDGGTLYWEGQGDDANTYRAAAPVRYPAPVNLTAPAISGGTGLGAALTLDEGTWQAEGASFARAWRRDGAPIPGETGTSHTLAEADAGAAVDCVVTASSSGGTAEAASNAIVADAFAAPTLNGSPTVSGTLRVGQTLTAAAAPATGVPAPVRSWQWHRDGTPIPGATEASLVLAAEDLGAMMSAVQTETNALGSASAESAAAGPVAEASEPAPSGPVIEMTGFDDATDSGTVSTDAPNDGDFIWATVEAGAGGWLGPILEAGLTAVGVSGAQVDFAYGPATGDGPRDLYVYQRTTAPADSNVVTVNFTADITAPALTGLAVTPGNGTLTLDWETDEDNGIYAWLVDTSPTPPTASTILAAPTGQGEVTAAGPQPAIVETGLPNGTVHYIHLVQRDLHGNTSAVATASGTPVAPVATAAPTLESVFAAGYHIDPQITGTPVSAPFTLSGMRPVLITVFLRNQSSTSALVNPTAIALEGGATPLDITAYQTVKVSDGRQNAMAYLVPAAALEAGTFTLSLTLVTGESTNATVFAVHEIEGAAADQTGAATGRTSGSTTAAQESVSLVTAGGDSLVVYAIDHQAGSDTTTATHQTLFDVSAGNSTHRAVLSVEAVALAGTQVSETFTWSAAVGGRAAIALEVLS